MAGKKKTKSSSRLSGGKSFLVSLFLGANIVTLVLLWACCASTWVNPVYHPNVGVIGLAFPVFLLLNLLFVPFWLIFKFRMVFVPVVGMALCGNYLLDYCPIRFGGSKPDATLSVMSWNSHNLGETPENKSTSLAFLSECGVDIIVLQEVSVGSTMFGQLYDAMELVGYQSDCRLGRAFFSRFPILTVTEIEADSYARNGAIAYDLLMDGDTLTVLNLHLECNRLTDEDKSGYGDVLRDPNRSKIKSQLHFLSGKLAVAARYRGLQVQALTHYLESLPKDRSVILCGDFNDTPISYAYQQVKRYLNNAYRSQGRGIGVSYREKLFPIRIDHIFNSADWECCEARVDRSINVSDHYPIVAKLRKRQK